MIINNKQINIWRGQDIPPTLYHIWLFNESELKIYNGVEWITIIDSINIAERLIELSDKIDNLRDDFESTTINGKLIKDNPILNSGDINNTVNGTYINTESLANNLQKIDKLLVTQILE